MRGGSIWQVGEWNSGEVESLREGQVGKVSGRVERWSINATGDERCCKICGWKGEEVET